MLGKKEIFGCHHDKLLVHSKVETKNVLHGVFNNGKS